MSNEKEQSASKHILVAFGTNQYKIPFTKKYEEFKKDFKEILKFNCPPEIFYDYEGIRISILEEEDFVNFIELNQKGHKLEIPSPMDRLQRILDILNKRVEHELESVKKSMEAIKEKESSAKNPFPVEDFENSKIKKYIDVISKEAVNSTFLKGLINVVEGINKGDLSEPPAVKTFDWDQYFKILESFQFEKFNEENYKKLPEVDYTDIVTEFREAEGPALDVFPESLNKVEQLSFILQQESATIVGDEKNASVEVEFKLINKAKFWPQFPLIKIIAPPTKEPKKLRIPKNFGGEGSASISFVLNCDVFKEPLKEKDEISIVIEGWNAVQNIFYVTRENHKIAVEKKKEADETAGKKDASKSS